MQRADQTTPGMTSTQLRGRPILVRTHVFRIVLVIQPLA